MAFIVTSILSSTVGILVNEARDMIAAKLKDGDVSDEKLREVVIGEMSNIQKKLDALERKDLCSSHEFLREGVDYLNAAFRDLKQNKTQDNEDKTSTMPSQILNKVVELSEAVKNLKSKSNDKFEIAKERFKEAREKATEAYSSEGLHIKDRIFAAKLQIVSQILEHLDDPSITVTGCMPFLKRFHELSAIEDTFTTYLNGGGFFNEKERAENVKSVMLINYMLFQYVSNFSTSYSAQSWPTIQLSDRTFSPILNWLDISTTHSMGDALTHPPNEMILREEIFTLYLSVNSHEHIVVAKKDTNHIKVLSRTGESKLVQLPHPNIAGLAVDKKNNVYVVTWNEESYTLNVLDGTNYNLKHDCGTLDFLGATEISLMKIAVNNNDNIIMIKDDDRHVYVCDSSGKLQRQFKRDSHRVHSLGFSKSDEIMISSGDEKAVNIYSEDGNLNSRIELPEDHKFCGLTFHYAVNKTIVLTYVENKDSYFFLYYTEAGELETKTLFCNGWSEFPQITSHPSGPVAVLRWRGKITFI